MLILATTKNVFIDAVYFKIQYTVFVTRNKISNFNGFLLE